MFRKSAKAALPVRPIFPIETGIERRLDAGIAVSSEEFSTVLSAIYRGPYDEIHRAAALA